MIFDGNRGYWSSDYHQISIASTNQRRQEEVVDATKNVIKIMEPLHIGPTNGFALVSLADLTVERSGLIRAP